MKKLGVIALSLSLLICESACAVSSESSMNGEKQSPWTDTELKAIVQTLAGECYDDRKSDKQKVCEVILNRVSNGKFGNSILDVITAPNQFHGYWKQSRPATKNDYEIAIQTLQTWHDNGCKALSSYLYFTAGPNRENRFY